MGSLTRYLQDGFARHCPRGWAAHPEASLLAPDLQKVLGFSPRADVLLAREDGGRRIWIEFEVSRADPVANHAKFAAAHLFAHDLENDVFLSMVSTHVVRGRRNLAAAMTGLMRRFGIRAFQTVLLPECAPGIVKTLNHMPPEALTREGPSVQPEVERALSVCESVAAVPGTTIYFAGDALDVLLNLSNWNDDLERPVGRAAWGRRRVKYFVHDPWTSRFAPSKFCAYLPFALGPDGSSTPMSAPRGGMTVEAYSRIDGLTPAFDGTRAWHHLARQLGFVVKDLQARPDLQRAFHEWHAPFRDAVPLHPEGPVLLSPPGWFR